MQLQCKIVTMINKAMMMMVTIMMIAFWKENEYPIHYLSPTKTHTHPIMNPQITQSGQLYQSVSFIRPRKVFDRK